MMTLHNGAQKHQTRENEGEKDNFSQYAGCCYNSGVQRTKNPREEHAYNICAICISHVI